MRNILHLYLREHGAWALLAEAVAMLSVFALLGGAFASPAASTAPSTAGVIEDAPATGANE